VFINGLAYISACWLLAAVVVGDIFIYRLPKKKAAVAA